MLISKNQYKFIEVKFHDIRVKCDYVDCLGFRICEAFANHVIDILNWLPICEELMKIFTE